MHATDATVVAVALAIATLVPSGSAGAAPPQQDRFPVDVVIPFPGVRAFDLIATSVGKNHLITGSWDADGNQTGGHLGGQLFVTFTRDDTGTARTSTISGPTFFDENGTIVRGTGRGASDRQPRLRIGNILDAGYGA